MIAGDYPRMVTFGNRTGVNVTAAEFGNKAAGLAEMDLLGIPVPPGFTLGVSLCEEYHAGGTLPQDVPELVARGIRFLEETTGHAFGGQRRPLILSVRSGAPVSMPGIMDTILNIGLNHDTIQGLIFSTGNPRFAWDSYRRFLRDYGQIIAGIEPKKFLAVLQKAMDQEDALDETELDSLTLRKVCGDYERILSASGTPVPEKVHEQLNVSIEAVLRSWANPKAESFRRLHLIDGVRGTAVTVQMMVFGNVGQNSGAGVAFTRNPWTGVNELVVDFKFGAQGEDVVSGLGEPSTQEEFSRVMPGTYLKLREIGSRLETYLKDMQDMEFTVQEGTLYLLQNRPGKRAPFAALRIAVDLCREGVITPAQALALLSGIDVDSIVDERVEGPDMPIARGIPASTGVATGTIVLSDARAAEDSRTGPVIFVSESASPEDIPGISAAAGLLTAQGARTSHAAVVAREMGKVCIVNCTGLSINRRRHAIRIGGQDLKEGQMISLDGNTGAVYLGKVEVVRDRPSDLISAVRGFRKAAPGQTGEDAGAGGD